MWLQDFELMRLCSGRSYKDDSAETETERLCIWLEHSGIHIATGASWSKQSIRENPHLRVVKVISNSISDVNIGSLNGFIVSSNILALFQSAQHFMQAAHF